MKKISFILLCISIPLMMSCASTQVKTMKYATSDLTSLKTFACYASTASFKAEQFQTKSNKPVDESLVSSINTKMIEKGFSLDEKNPDVVIFVLNSNEINSNGETDQQNSLVSTHINPDNFPSNPGGMKGYKIYGNDIEYIKDIPLTSGALVVEVFNRESKELLWIGVAKDFTAHISDQTLMSRMISEIFEKFPN